MNATHIPLEQDATGALFAPVYKCARKCGNLANWRVGDIYLCTACKEEQERHDALKAQHLRHINHAARFFNNPIPEA